MLNPDIMMKVYKPQLQSIFKHHPRGNRIVDAILAHELTFNEIDLVFQEAENYTWNHFTSRFTNKGTITFKVV